MTSHRKRALFGALIALGWVSGCSDHPCTTCVELPTGLVVSDPIPAPALSAGQQGSVARATDAGTDVAYVSLAPGTVSAGREALVRRVGDVSPLATGVTDGGFDPIPVVAQPGDLIDIAVQDAVGASIYSARVVVAASRRPVIVRTEPPPRKRDVPLNAAIVVVFSEPMQSATVTTSSLQLFLGANAITGTVRFLQGSGAVAAFVPAAPLEANADYRLVVSRAPRDLGGDPLGTGETVDFTTGQSLTGPAASIALSPDSVFMSGATYQMTAMVRDAAGNTLIDQPITWSTSDPAGLSASQTGLLTAQAAGSYTVTASVNGLQAQAHVNVLAGPAATVVISPAQATVGASGDTINLIATVRDAGGRLLASPQVTWTSSAPATATVGADSSGRAGLGFATVTGVRQGSATITAGSGAASKTASITVIASQPVASVTVTPASATMVVQGMVKLAATLRDASNKVLSGRLITWTSDNPGVATVDANGLVTGVSLGPAAVMATSEGVSDTAAISVTLLSFRSVTAGGSHTCGVTPNGAVFCWGDNQFGELGIGSDTGRCGDPLTSGPWPCSMVPAAVTGELSFTAASAGGRHTCGLTASAAAYCWGWADNGALGNGTRTPSIRPTPVAVQGGLTFAAVSAAGGHTCGVTTGGAAYCWGVFDGSGNIWPSPVAIQGGLNFAAVSQNCGLTRAGAAYCWGGVNGLVPVAVSGGLSFTMLTAGGGHTCGLTSAGAAYCWGGNYYGQLGDGSTTGSPSPVTVLGELSFAAVSAGHDHTCGVTTGGAAYCWGYNFYGQLGGGSYADSPTPAAVQGGLSFAAVSAGENHTCGVTTAGTAYCWGFNYSGQLGDGTRSPNGGRYSSSVPVKVAGQP